MSAGSRRCRSFRVMKSSLQIRWGPRRFSPDSEFRRVPHPSRSFRSQPVSAYRRNLMLPRMYTRAGGNTSWRKSSGARRRSLIPDICDFPRGLEATGGSPQRPCRKAPCRRVSFRQSHALRESLRAGPGGRGEHLRQPAIDGSRQDLWEQFVR